MLRFLHSERLCEQYHARVQRIDRRRATQISQENVMQTRLSPWSVIATAERNAHRKR